MVSVCIDGVLCKASKPWYINPHGHRMFGNCDIDNCRINVSIMVVGNDNIYNCTKNNTKMKMMRKKKKKKKKKTKKKKKKMMMMMMMVMVQASWTSQVERWPGIVLWIPNERSCRHHNSHRMAPVGNLRWGVGRLNVNGVKVANFPASQAEFTLFRVCCAETKAQELLVGFSRCPILGDTGIGLLGWSGDRQEHPKSQRRSWWGSGAWSDSWEDFCFVIATDWQSVYLHFFLFSNLFSSMADTDFLKLDVYHWLRCGPKSRSFQEIVLWEMGI